jgi:cytochrome c
MNQTGLTSASYNQTMKLGGIVCLTVLLVGPAQASDKSVGHMIVEQECSSCHAVEGTGESPNPKSPPFRTFVNRYPSEQLAEALTNRTSIAHGDMPEFMFEPEDISEVVIYLETLRAK